MFHSGWTFLAFTLFSFLDGELLRLESVFTLMARKKKVKQRAESSESPTVETRERLQKVLAAAGLGSRRACEELITVGRVTVDGKAATKLGFQVDTAEQVIRVDGEVVKSESKIFYLLNKPAGYLCTNRDPRGRPRAIDLIPDSKRLFNVGRLDENSEGLLLVTNDGYVGNRLAHPRYGIPKTYRVQVAGKPTRETLSQLRDGIYFTEGKFKVRSVRAFKTKGNSTFLEVVLNEGQNREIRRLFARVGHKVLYLQRVAFGPLKIGRLGLGKYRILKPSEVDELRELVSKRKAMPKKSVREKSNRSDSKSSASTTKASKGRARKTASKRSSSKPTKKKSTRRIIS